MKIKVILPIISFVLSLALLFNFPSIYKILAASTLNSIMFFILGFLLDKRNSLQEFFLSKKVFYILFLISFIYFSLFYELLGMFVFLENAGMIGGVNGPNWIYVLILMVIYAISIFVIIKSRLGFVFATLFLFLSFLISYSLTSFLEVGLVCRNNRELPIVRPLSFNQQEYDKFKYKNILNNTIYSIGDMYSNGYGTCEAFPWYIKTISKGDVNSLYGDTLKMY